MTCVRGERKVTYDWRRRSWTGRREWRAARARRLRLMNVNICVYRYISEGGRRCEGSGLRKTVRGRNRRMERTSRGAVEKTGPAEVSEKVAEKRRRLGRGRGVLLRG